MRQATIKKTIDCSGIGLHSGKMVRLCLHPAPENTGVLFCLASDEGTKFLSPTPESVVTTGLATTLGFGKDTVSTVEHLLAAIRGLEIDNIRIDVEGGEVPIMDGSAASFVFLLRSAGLRRQSAPRRVLRVTRPVAFESDGKWIKAEPYDGFAVNCRIDFPHPLIGEQAMHFDLSPEAFTRHIAKARTFGFLRDVEMLHKHGLALGGSLENAVVLDEYAIVNPEGLRFQDEFVRHKVLDFIGDMAMIGLPLQGRFDVSCSGHALNNGFLRMLHENRDLYLAEVALHDGAPTGLPESAPAGEMVPAMA